MKKHLPVILFILSIAFLIPGLSLPLMTIKATVDKQEMLNMAVNMLLPPEQSHYFLQNMVFSIMQRLKLEENIEVFESTRSLLSTMHHLIVHDHVMVGLLIGLFGVFIPIVKIGMIFSALLLTSIEHKNKLFRVSGLMSKWSMSDVFMMAILVSFLAINANEHSIKSVQMHAELGIGFYFFSAYCLLAIATNQFLTINTDFP